MSWRSSALLTLRIALLASVYAVAGKLCLQLDAVAGFATLVWPPTGIALAALWFFGPNLWPGVALGGFLVNLWVGAAWPLALSIGLGNMLEAVAGVYLLRHLGRMQGPLERTRHVWVLVGPVSFGSSMISASIGVASLLAARIIDRGGISETWRAWWLGDALGVLTVGSLLLSWAGVRVAALRWSRLVEAAALAALSFAVGISVFFSAPAALGGGAFLREYLLFPLLIWAGLRFGLPGATATTFLSSTIAIAGTAARRGPFVHDTLAESLLYLQGFMTFAAVTALSFGAVVNELAQAIRARESVLAVVSHDLKNPLNTVRMAAAILKARDDGDRTDLAFRIERAVDRMDRLIRDLLDLAALDAGAMSLDLRLHDARRLVEEAVEMMRPLASERDQTLSVATERDDVSILCDRERVLQVFSNLIGNAILYTPNGGAITVAVESHDAGTARLRVTDTGAGIDAADLPEVFERFRRGQRARHDGTGLGLSIAKAIVVAHGGRIWASSRPGQGSTFSFTVRAQTAAAEPVPHPSRRIERTSG
jgi:signal transduction histidine kinase